MYVSIPCIKVIVMMMMMMIIIIIIVINPILAKSAYLMKHDKGSAHLNYMVDGRLGSRGYLPVAPRTF
jgi:hypothetical protein